MRTLFIVLALLAPACSKAPEKAHAAQAPEPTFDGALETKVSAEVSHGERLSHVLGCRGCHQANLEGIWFNEDSPELGKLYASNLTRALPTMTDAQLEALLRTGKHPTRGDLWIMPSEIFQRLGEADMKALIAHLRTVKPSGKPTPPPALSALARKLVASGKLKPTSAWIAEYRDKVPPDMGRQYALGRYIAATTCAECHGAELTGIPNFEPGVSTPDLDIAGTYSDSELAELLTTGKGKTKPNLGLMSQVGKRRFSYLTANERSAVIAYLKARANRPATQVASRPR
jgi:cytochrome c553